MLHKIKLEHILFLDIETVSEYENYSDLTEEMRYLWAEKTKYQRKEEFTPEEFYDRAGIWSEFGKIICVSVGYFVIKEGYRSFRTKSFHGEEKQLLIDFKNVLEKYFSKPHHLMCAHNGKEFDFPYIARRMIIHAISLPSKLNLFGKKPWEISHLDTLDLWKFGDYKHYTSLKLLTTVLGVPSPKDDIDGSQVGQVYYKEKNIGRIIVYCEKDTVAVAQIILRLRQEELLKEEEILSV